MSPRVVVAGFICVDLIPQFLNEPGEPLERVLHPGGMVNIGGITVASGGCVANTGIALARLGVPVCFMGKTGQDSLGQLLVNILAPHGDVSGIRGSAADVTGSTVVLAPRGGDRQFLSCAGANDTFAAADLDLSALRQGDLFHFGYPSLMRSLATDGGVELGRIMRAARAAGATTSLDLSLPDLESPAGRADWRRIWAEVLPHVDMFLPSIEEAFFSLDPGEYRRFRERLGDRDFVAEFPLQRYGELARRLLDYGCGMVALKAGASGWYLRTSRTDRLAGWPGLKLAAPEAWAHRQWWAPGYPAGEIAGTTGAGDAAIAGFLASLTRRLGPLDALRFANAAGLASLSAPDAVGGLRDWQQLERQVEAGRPVALSLDGWRRGPEGVYVPDHEDP